MANFLSTLVIAVAAAAAYMTLTSAPKPEVAHVAQVGTVRIGNSGMARPMVAAAQPQRARSSSPELPQKMDISGIDLFRPAS